MTCLPSPSQRAVPRWRAALWQRVADAEFLTVNEKREAVGYGPLPDGDQLG